MKVLAIETSTMLGGAAVVDEQDGLIAEIRLNIKTTHSERLMTAVDTILKQSELKLNDIDAVAVSTGPGSFTGLRIGLSTAKGLCYASGRPLVTVPTLEAFAWNFTFSKHPICLMLDARKKEVYAAVFQWKERGFKKIISETIVKPSELFKKLVGSTVFAGDGVKLYEDQITEHMKDRAILAPPEKMVPFPSNIAMLGLRKALKREFSSASYAVPFYIRKSEAEVKWEEKNL
ncbi:MAG: tRNA (adenosine(37)-N6)-threonylcarbamoyltransferase complex dimerization subunit type 1 TsaB [Nitrospiraceae bacterium]|nr:MAG: tRNA (adenosine(37)-N6)-threonylcarbamoyltransferase complex dimerization subunit type 1 TsaB [Nitrospiraceae bacterium]